VTRGVLAIAIFIPTLLGASAAHAQVYRWVDENGRVRYGDTPPASAQNVQKKQGRGAAGDEPMPFGMQRAMQDYPVTLYTAANCGNVCADGKALLDKRGVPHREVVLRTDEQINELKAKNGGQIQVPALQVGTDIVSGFERGAWTAKLDRAGYPASTVGFKPQQSAALPAVKLYTNWECKDACDGARKLLAERKVQFEEVNVDSHARFDELEKVSGGMSVPVLVVGKVVQRGFLPGTYHRVLNEQGFPN
jgi:glutaredoxin